MHRARHVAPLLCAWVLLLSADPALAQRPPAEESAAGTYLPLPLQAAAEVKERYVRRLEAALADLERADQRGKVNRDFRWPQSKDQGPCATRPSCLQEVAQKVSAPRLLAWVLEADGYDFVLRVVRWHATTPDRISEQRFPIRHHALAREGRRIVEEQLLAPPKEEAASARVQEEKSPQVSAASASTDKPKPVEEADESPLDSSGAEAEAKPAASSEQSQRPGKPLTLHQVAARMGAGRVPGGAAEDEEEKGGGLFAGARSEGSSEKKKKTKEDWEAYWAKRKAAYAASAEEEPSERRARQVGILLMGLVGLASASVGFFFGHQLNFRIRRRKVSFEAKVGAKEAAMTMATLRDCARQLTPGVLMSPEFETSKRFCFSLVDGNQISLDVMQLSEDERAAFRVGMQLCAQFVHKEGTAMCMMSVLRVQKMSPSRLRLVLSAPERLAQVTRPKGFKIPVDRSTPLLARALRSSEKGTDQWQALVSVVSDSTLEMTLDEDAFTMAEGDRIDLKLRMDDIQADVVGQVVQLSSESVHFELEDKHGGHPPREYQNLVRKLEGQWLSTLGS